MIENLNYWFNAGWSCGYVKYLAPQTILDYLVAGYPLYGAFEGNNGRHAVVIRGVNTAARTFSVMNPNPNTNGYTTGTFSSSNGLSFISSYNNDVFAMYAYGFPVNY